MVWKAITCAIVISLSAAMVQASNIGGDREDIELTNDGGYARLLVAIDENLPENLDILTNIQVGFGVAVTLVQLKRLILAKQPKRKKN